MPEGFIPHLQKDRARINLLGTDIDNLTLEETVTEIIRMAGESGYRYVITPNVDHIMRLRSDSAFLEAYNGAALVVPDGVPLVWVSRILGTPLKGRVNGTDLFERVCEAAAKTGMSVFFLGAGPGVAERAAAVLKTKYPGLVVAGYDSPPRGFDRDSRENERIARIVRESGADILFTAFGSPKQELWMLNEGAACGAHVAAGIGASFDFVAGELRRAPVWMQRHGLEWFWRLLSEPGRLWRRYLVDDLPFVALVFREYLRKRFVKHPAGKADSI